MKRFGQSWVVDVEEDDAEDGAARCGEQRYSEW